MYIYIYIIYCYWYIHTDICIMVIYMVNMYTLGLD